MVVAGCIVGNGVQVGWEAVVVVMVVVVVVVVVVVAVVDVGDGDGGRWWRQDGERGGVPIVWCCCWSKCQFAISTGVWADSPHWRDVDGVERGMAARRAGGGQAGRGGQETAETSKTVFPSATYYTAAVQIGAV